MPDLSPEVARRIIDIVGGNGIPPPYGFQFFTAGLDPYLSIIDGEYLATFIRQGGSTFKMVVGLYGGGKTHFLYCVRDLAWKHNFVVSYVSLSPGASPFHKLELVYRAIVRGMMPPLTPEELLSGYEQGIVSFLRSWYAMKHSELTGLGLSGVELTEGLRNEARRIEGTESISFANAVKRAFESLLEGQDEDFMNICQWLSGEGYIRSIHGKYGILERVDRTTAFPLIRSLVQWVRQIGYSGLVILLDEAERVPSLSTKQRELHLNNLREIIDECGQSSFQGVAIFYAVPDENFLDGRGQIYEALNQRVATIFDTMNPSGVKIELEKLATQPVPFLEEVGNKLRGIYETAYCWGFDDAAARKTVRTIAEIAYEQRFGDIGYKRLFVQKLVKGLHFLRKTGRVPSCDDV